MATDGKKFQKKDHNLKKSEYPVLKSIGWIFSVLLPFFPFLISLYKDRKKNKGFFIKMKNAGIEDPRMFNGPNFARLSVLIVILPLFLLASLTFYGVKVLGSLNDSQGIALFAEIYLIVLLSFYALRTVAAGIGLLFTKAMFLEMEAKGKSAKKENGSLVLSKSLRSYDNKGFGWFFISAISLGLWGNDSVSVKKNLKGKNKIKKTTGESIKEVLGYVVGVLLVLGIFVMGGMLAGEPLLFFNHLPTFVDAINAGWTSLSWQTLLPLSVVAGSGGVLAGFLPTQKTGSKIVLGLVFLGLSEGLMISLVFFFSPNFIEANVLSEVSKLGLVIGIPSALIILPLGVNLLMNWYQQRGEKKENERNSGLSTEQEMLVIRPFASSPIFGEVKSQQAPDSKFPSFVIISELSKSSGSEPDEGLSSGMGSSLASPVSSLSCVPLRSSPKFEFS